MAKLDGIGLGLIAVGAGLTYAGAKGVSIPSLIQGFVTGQPPGNASLVNQIQAVQGATQNTPTPGLTSGAGGSPGGTSGGSPSANQQLAKFMAGGPHPTWITGSEWSDWVSLWDRESGWSQTADTRKTGLDPQNATVFAYGIPQARPYSKMPKAAWPPDKGGKSDPATQIAWGIAYIAGTYGSPSAAWAHEQANGWY